MTKTRVHNRVRCGSTTGAVWVIWQFTNCIQSPSRHHLSHFLQVHLNNMQADQKVWSEWRDSGLSLDFQACGWLWIRMSLTAILLQHVSFSEHRQAWKWRGRSSSLIAYCVRLGGVCTSSPPSSNKKRPEIHRTLRCPRSQKEVASVFQTRISWGALFFFLHLDKIKVVHHLEQTDHEWV